MRQSRAPRVARGAVAASGATFVALMSHVAGGGAMPGWVGIAVPWVLSLTICVLLAGRRLSLLRLSVAVTLSQVLFHALFVLGAASPSPATHATGHVHGVMNLAPTTGVSPMMHADALMWTWHGIAAFVTVAALYRGERATMRLHELAGQLVGWVHRRITAVVVVPAVAPSGPIVDAAAERGWHISSIPYLATAWRRGPPTLTTL